LFLPPFSADLDLLAKVTVKYVTLPGWNTDISNITTWEALPETCKAYVEFIEKFVGVPVEWIGVGPARESMYVQTTSLEPSFRNR